MTSLVEIVSAKRREEQVQAAGLYDGPRIERRPCVVAGCGKPIAYRGLCHQHYMRQMRDRYRRSEGEGLGPCTATATAAPCPTQLALLGT